jgi:2-polyprenyl-3-methyl-5-hydroxy-6-metoxy-1,4-benzoquinol methylase
MTEEVCSRIYIDEKKFNVKMDVMNISCPLCNGAAGLAYQGHPGYVFGRTYDIYSCDQCQVSFVYPLFVEKKDYDEIYADAENLSGYDKYYALSQRILSADNPLDVMSGLGDEYAYVISRLRACVPKGSSVLEVGCGFGYLTYSLNRSGYNATGVDVSEISVNRATKTYGPYYQCIGLNDFSQLHGRRFDCIVLTEVLEHVMDPISFLNSLKSLLTENGLILLTTPNKSAFPSDALWMTDAPPIHLWWFSENSLSVLAEKVSMKPRIYKGYVTDRLSYHYWNRSDNLSLPMFVPEFDNQGRLVKNSREFSLDSPSSSITRNLYARFVPDSLDSTLIRFRNRIRESQKTEYHCTMFVELKKTVNS